ncbi:MAG: Na+/H+ antiporter subunit D, partial [Hyphomicrobiaceae bacterium]|nr:Na+/H+ antiporter subunit D [Hyphomicrobiaceae bacterium]
MAGTVSHDIDLSHALVLDPVAGSDYLVVLPVIVPFLFAAVTLMLRRKRDLHAPIAATVMASLVLSNLAMLARVLDSGPIAMTMGRWLPPFGISFVVD